MTKKQTALDAAKKTIKEIEEKRRADVAVACEKLQGAEDALELANSAIKTATERMDIDAFADAKAAAANAQTEIEMYAGRLQQIKEQEYISEDDSDRVIDSLLDYEDELEAALDDAVAEPIEMLRTILADHMNEVKEVEATLQYWVSHIHATYVSRTGRKRIDPETGLYTNRMDTPQRLRYTPYTGGSTVAVISSFLRGISK